jgi:hypothetical protein
MHVHPENFLSQDRANDWIRDQVFGRRATSATITSSTSSTSIAEIEAMLPHLFRIPVVQAGTNITITENALGPVISATTASSTDFIAVQSNLPHQGFSKKISAGSNITITEDAGGYTVASTASGTTDVLQTAIFAPRSQWELQGQPILQSGGNISITYNGLGPIIQPSLTTTSRVLGRKTAGAGVAEECSLSDILDFIGSATRGDMLVRGTSAWQKVSPSTAGYVLTDNGAGAVPSFQTSSAGTAVSQYDLPQVFTLALARGNIHYWSIGTASGSPISQSLGTITPTSSTGSFAFGTLAGTDLFSGSTRYVGTSATGAGSQVWYSSSSSLLCVRGGFLFGIRGAVADAATVANSRMFMGFRAANAAPSNVEPDTFTDCIGIAAKAGDANLSILHNDSSGTATMATLGANFPAQTLSTDVYKLEVYCAPGASTIYWRVQRENTGDIATGNFNTDLPTSTTLMGPQWWRNNGTTALAVKIAVMTSYAKFNLEA